jgi:Mg-chelatase subunit ChlD
MPRSKPIAALLRRIIDEHGVGACVLIMLTDGEMTVFEANTTKLGASCMMAAALEESLYEIHASGGAADKPLH